MQKQFITVLLIFCLANFTFGQIKSDTNSEKKEQKTEKDSLKKRVFLEHIGLGYFPTKYFNFDLRHLFKFNQYEGFRTGAGGITTDNFSENFRVNGYLVYGFVDKAYKYSLGGGLRLNKATNTWLNFSYTEDLQESGSSKFLTDKRFFSFFEPRLININLFHRHTTKAISVEHKISEYLLSETQFSKVNINPTYNYSYVNNGKTYNNFNLSLAQVSLQWSPFSKYEYIDKKIEETKEGYPKFTAQLTKSFSNVLNSDLKFTKVDFRTIHKIKHSAQSHTNLNLVAGLATGELPLTHLYHASPNNINKETLLQRFSVAGLNSFETMFFNEFFSDRFASFQVKHALKPFKITQRWQPQLVLISRHVIGDAKNPGNHIGLTFNTLDKLYSEAGFEINKLIWPFGFSFAYRYGSYHLSQFEDNFAFKFTFNISL